MEKVTQTARTLLMVAVMIASAILPMVPEAAELRDEARAMGASISTDVTTVTLDEGGWTVYEVSLDEAPDGTLVITPSSDNSAVTVDPSYLKFTKVNWDMPQYVYVDITDTDDDGADTTATISHSISGTDSVFSTAPGDVSVTGTDYDTDTDGDGLHDGLDTDDDDDGVDDSAEDAGCDLLADCDGDGVNDDTDAFDTDANATTDTDGDGDADEISVTGAVFDFDFEDGSLPTAATWELSQCTGSDSSCVAGTTAGDWTVSDDTPIDGAYSVKSGDLSTSYENTNISVTFTSAEGTMSFDYQISSLCRDYTSTYYDGFRLYVDGVQVDNPSDGGTACSNGVWGGVGTATWDTTHPAYSTSYFMCEDGDAGFSISYVPSWLGDGYNDCSDGSDEDSTYTDGLLYEPPVSGSHEQALSAGTHTVLFQFHGGTSGAAGLSIAWIDNLVIPVAAGTAGSVGPTSTTDGTALDNDDDDDGYSDLDETTNCQDYSDPLDANDFPMWDNDGDYSCDAVDDDDDDDGVLDADEADGSALDLDADGTADGINCANETDCDG
ncbi:MAG: LDL receptor domain-containing protein, partial [Candidatus Thalassarchaeaceae archaeon]|nr:LDL receptor domain-containing protein [Candidatus Thalassarchaeaceae archaeon]